MKLVEVEGTHTVQQMYSSLDIHCGQSYSVLITADQSDRDYYIVVSSRFTNPILATTGVLHYSNSASKVSGPIPGGPTIQVDWSLNQARSIRFAIPIYFFLYHILKYDVVIVNHYLYNNVINTTSMKTIIKIVSKD